MFRRILSPRQPPDGKSTRGPPTETLRSQSTSALQLNGHRREGSDEAGEIEVKNFGYGDPDIFNAPVRTQSMVTTPSKEMNPPLPPRNARIASFGHSGRAGDVETESSLYVTPADTLRSKPSSSSSVASANSHAPGNMEASADQVHATKSERKVMQMHQLTMQQRKGQSQSVSSGSVAASGTTSKQANGHRRTNSFGNMTENSDYSVPFNLVEKGARPPVKPPRMVAQVFRHDNSERIIAINPPSTSPQPPSDRSDTTSPSSPLSNQSVEPEPPRQDENSDYAIPWDRNKVLRNVRKTQGKRDMGFADESGGGTSTFGHSTAPPHRPRGADREEVQLHQQFRNEEMKPRSVSVKDHDPPPPHRSMARYQSAREPMLSYPNHGGVMAENSPPPPELPFDPERPHRNRMPSARAPPRRDSSSSPVPPALDHYPPPTGHPPPHTMRYVSTPHAPHAHHDRPLPESPMERPLPPPRDHSSRDHTSRDSSAGVNIDISIPLEDQPWYHGSVTRAEAERILRDQPDFSFLVRKSESCETDYSLSIRDISSASGGYYHLRLVFEEDPTPGYVLGQFSSHYEKVTECIANYTKQRLNIRGAEHKRLRYPIPRSPMDRHHITTVGV